MTLTGGERQTHVEACDHRAMGNQHMRSLVDRLENEILGSEPREKSPTKIAERFDALKEASHIERCTLGSVQELISMLKTLRYILDKLGATTP